MLWIDMAQAINILLYLSVAVWSVDGRRRRAVTVVSFLLLHTHMKEVPVLSMRLLHPTRRRTQILNPNNLIVGFH